MEIYTNKQQSNLFFRTIVNNNRKASIYFPYATSFLTANIPTYLWTTFWKTKVTDAENSFLRLDQQIAQRTSM